MRIEGSNFMNINNGNSKQILTIKLSSIKKNNIVYTVPSISIVTRVSCATHLLGEQLLDGVKHSVKATFLSIINHVLHFA